MPRASVLLVAAAAAILLGAGCRAKQSTTIVPTAPVVGSTPTPAAPLTASPGAVLVAPAPLGPPPPDIPSVPNAPADAEARVIRVIAKQWEWQPREIRAKKGDRIALEITSVEVTHGISIPEFNVNRTLAPGRTERIEFIADKAGRFEFTCNVYCGRGHRDMRGVLVVEE